MIVAGFGFSTRATVASLRDALDRARGDAAPAALATAADKVAALAPLATAMDVPVIALPAAALAAQATATTSPRARALRGTGSVAEAAALAALAPGARLIGPRVTSTDRLACCALAEGDPA